MKSVFWLQQIPLWGVFFVTVTMILVSILIGKYLGYRRRCKPGFEAEAPFGLIITATLGLLAFMLAFTFGFTAELFQNRKKLFLEEINAIGTTYLRAGLLSQPHQNEIRELLRQYVDIRAQTAKEILQDKQVNLVEVISRSEKLQDQMWSHAAAAAETSRNPVIDALFINSLNEMIDLQTSRLTVFRYQIPPIVWYVLYFLIIVSTITVGYQDGLSGKKDFKAGIVLAFTLSAVIFLIADLDRAAEGHLRVDQRPMFELQEKMHTTMSQENPK